MNGRSDNWLTHYAAEAASTDRLTSHKDHVQLLAAGIMGEVGSILAEAKKIRREAESYPAYRHRLVEEVGDFLWYFTRLCSTTCPELLGRLALVTEGRVPEADSLTRTLNLGASVGQLVDLTGRNRGRGIEAKLEAAWENLLAVSADAGISLPEAARQNIAKTKSRWPTEKVPHGLFDENSAPEEQIPRRLAVDFLERKRGSRVEMLLRCCDVGIGNRLTDNITDPDGYRYHDVFHMANAVFLGWSPVLRALLHCKRKSEPAVDENQDGARAAVLEEAVSAMVFSRAKRAGFFEDIRELDYDLLKGVHDCVEGFEVECVPLWQWEEAILQGFQAFRLLRASGGGRVRWDLRLRTLQATPF